MPACRSGIVIDQYADAGLQHVLCTDVARDGAMTGPNFGLYAGDPASAIRRLRLQASGGVRHIDDLQQLRDSALPAAITGRALLDGEITRSGGGVIPAKRIIPCLDVRDGVVVKGVQFRNHRIVGDILELAAALLREGADELVFYDITASPGRPQRRSQLGQPGRCDVLDIPFCVAGGIRSVADAEDVLNKGADKISINSPALANPELITELARRFGSQCVVIGIDSREEHDDYFVYQYTGDPDKTRPAQRTDRRLGARSAGSRCRRDRPQLHEPGRRAPGLRHGAAGRRACRSATCR